MIAANDPVARHNNREWVASHCTTGGSGGLRPADCPGNVGIAQSLTVGYGSKGSPHGFLKGGAMPIQCYREFFKLACEVSCQFLFGQLDNVILSFNAQNGLVHVPHFNTFGVRRTKLWYEDGF